MQLNSGLIIPVPTRAGPCAAVRVCWQVISALAIALLPVLSVFFILVLIICIGARQFECSQLV